MHNPLNMSFRNLWILCEDVHKYSWAKGDMFLETEIGGIHYCRINLDKSASDQRREKAITSANEMKTYYLNPRYGSNGSNYENMFQLDATHLNDPAIVMRNVWLSAKKHLYLTTDSLPGIVQADPASL